MIYKIVWVCIVVYSVIIVVIGGFMVYMFVICSLFDINVLYDCNLVVVRFSDGLICNVYIVWLFNKSGYDCVIVIDVEGLVNFMMYVVGVDFVMFDWLMIVILCDFISELCLFVIVLVENNLDKLIFVCFYVMDIGFGIVVIVIDNFVVF